MNWVNLYGIYMKFADLPAVAEEGR